MTKNSTKKIPRLRFKGFEGEWEEKRLNDFIRILNGLTYSPNDIRERGTFVIRSSNINNDHIVNSDNVYVDSSVVNAENVRTNDVVIVVRNGSRKLIGKHALVVNEMNKTVVGAFMSLLRGRNGKFINSLLSTNNFAKEIHKSLGATINQITKKDFSLMKFYIPNDQEQKKIGLFFAKLDQLIDLQSKKVEQLKKLKRGYLQKMFPQKGESVPRLRFNGFSGEWEEKLLSSVTIVKTGKSKYVNHNKDATYMYPILGSTNIIGYDSSYDYYDNFVLIARVGNAGNIYCFSGRVKITDNTIYLPYKYPLFLSSILNNYNIKFLSFGSGRKLIKSNDIKKIKLTLPSYDEQNNIDIFIKKIMKIILVEDKKVDSLRNLKKSYLQKMFC